MAMGSLRSGVIYLFVLINFTSSIAYDGGEDEIDDYYTTSDVAKGKENYRLFVERKHVFGECWSHAMEKLDIVCGQMTASALKKLAFEFADCFLPTTNASKRDCSGDTDVANCADSFGPSFYSTYVQLFTNAKSTCFFLEAQKSQRRAEEKLLLVADMAKIAGAQLSTLNDAQNLLVEKQQNAIMSADKIESWLGNLADRITNLQFDFIDQFTSFYSYVFYLLAIAACFVLSATQRTSGARFWLFLLLTVTFSFEKFCAKTKLEAMVGQQDTKVIQQELNDDAKLIRQGFIFLAVLILLYFAYTYVDPYEKHFELLTKIERMIKDSGMLRQALERGRSVSVARDNVDSTNTPRADRANSLLRRSIHSGAPSPDTPSTTNNKLGRFARTPINSPLSPRSYVRPLAVVREERESSTPPRHPLPNGESETNGVHAERETSQQRSPIRPYNLRSGNSPLKFPDPSRPLQHLNSSRAASRERTPLEGLQERVLDILDSVGRIRASREASREPSLPRNGINSARIFENVSDGDSE